MSSHDLIEAALVGPRFPSHLYIHVPFCRVKCSYCDFYSETDIDSDRVDATLSVIEAQIQQWSGLGLPGVLETLYLGGGTPTIITGGVVRIVRAALESMPVRDGAEVTVEANPDSVTRELMEAYAAAGVTRVSLGIQSFVDTELGILGRVHTTEEAVSACRHVTDTGMNLSVDLMCGIPRQTTATWLVSVEAALATGAEHFSVYPLTLEEGTPLEVACSTGLAPEPEPDLAAEMMLAAEERFLQAGVPRYEIANYAVPGKECRHNIAYWTGRPYIGIGPAAHGMLDVDTAKVAGVCAQCPEDVGRVRYAGRADIDAWLTGVDLEVEYLSSAQADLEDVMLGLRLTRGVPNSLAHDAGAIGVLEELARNDLVELVTDRGEQRWRTTRRGWLLGNEVFGPIWDLGADDDLHSDSPSDSD